MTTFEERLSRLEGVYDHLASKADVAELKVAFQEDVAELRLDIQKDISVLRLDIQKDISVKVERTLKPKRYSRFDGVSSRFDGVSSRFDGVSSRFDGVEGRLDRIEKRLDRLIFALFGAGLAFGVGMAVLIVRSFAAG